MTPSDTPDPGLARRDAADAARDDDPAPDDPAPDDPAPDDTVPDDSKMYTGEPVDTPEGTQRPQQMNVGADNMQGGGEWPDPETPPAQ
jgi:hypothetical protein